MLSFALTYRNELTLKDCANLSIRRALKPKWQGCMEVDDFHKGRILRIAFLNEVRSEFFLFLESGYQAANNLCFFFGEHPAVRPEEGKCGFFLLYGIFCILPPASYLSPLIFCLSSNCNKKDANGFKPYCIFFII